jgi:cation diffusion facilitator CzcD-associated flavoprotein CzcO
MDAPGGPDSFAPLADVIATFNDYAVRIEAPVRHAEVTSLRPNAGAFKLTLADDTLVARSVVVATGAFQQPTALPAAADVPTGILQMHTAAYRNPDELPDGSVLVVGSGQSGCEIGQELLEAGRTVHLAVGRCGWAPRRYRGRELMRWMIDVGAMDETSDVLASPRARLAGNVAVSGSHGGRDCNPLVLEALGVRLFGRFVGFDGGRALFRVRPRREHRVRHDIRARPVSALRRIRAGSWARPARAPVACARRIDADGDDGARARTRRNRDSPLGRWLPTRVPVDRHTCSFTVVRQRVRVRVSSRSSRPCAG